MKRSLIVLIIMSVLTLLIVACGQETTSASVSPARTATPRTPTATQSAIIHMDDSQFVQKSITLKKGQRFTLIDDSPATHVVSNGSWQRNNLPTYAREVGAPKIDLQFNGQSSQSVGPFNTAGTFHLYCTVHLGMNLTVIVH